MKRLVAVLALSLLAAAGNANVSGAGKTAGNAVAPLMIEVFSDFQCPSCKVFHEGTLRALIDDYVSKGKVYLVFREFPLPMHAFAREASSYACAAAQVGKYSEVGSALFARQGEWSNNGKVADAACSVLTPAQAQKVRALAKEAAIRAEIESDLKLGQSAGVNSTPTLLITHKLKRYPVSGTLNYNLLRRLLDDLLAK
jgi:protein-disulfide isomerase